MRARARLCVCEGVGAGGGAGRCGDGGGGGGVAFVLPHGSVRLCLFWVHTRAFVHITYDAHARDYVAPSTRHLVGGRPKTWALM